MFPDGHLVLPTAEGTVSGVDVPNWAASAERVAKEAEGARLQVLVEVDEDVATRHDLHLRKHRVSGQAANPNDDFIGFRCAR